MIDNNYKCCNSPKYLMAYTLCKPFKAKYCVNCGEVIFDSNPIIEWIFKYIFAPFWNGTIKVEDDGKSDIR